MLFHDLVSPTNNLFHISSVLKTQCGQFIRESQGLPLYKAYSSSLTEDFKRVKVRFHRRRDTTSTIFDNAFGINNSTTGFRERAVFTTGAMPALTELTKPFYVFPIDGYEYIFSKQVSNSSHELTDVLNTLKEDLDSDLSHDIVADLLKYSYQNTNLVEGIQSQNEIIIHNMSSFYIVDATAYPNYKLLIL